MSDFFAAVLCIASQIANAVWKIIPFYPQVLTKKKLQDLVREVDPNEQLDEDVEEVSYA